jgi:hypothetical protein
MTTQKQAHRIDRLLDAVELVKHDRREEARVLLRQLIHEDGNFEDAWLWMSVAVDSLDQSSVCLDNVLRVNPSNRYAAGALYRIREIEMRVQRRRARLLFYRDTAYIGMWVIILTLLFVMALMVFTSPVMM